MSSIKVPYSSTLTATKIYYRSTEMTKFCLVCGTVLPANSSFYNISHAGLLENLNVLLETGLKEKGLKSNYVCKSCFRRVDMVVKKRNVLQMFVDELRTKYANTCKTLSSPNRSERVTFKRLSNESPEDRQKKKINRNFSPRTRSTKKCLFDSSETCTSTFDKENTEPVLASDKDKSGDQQEIISRRLFNPAIKCSEKIEERQIKVSYCKILNKSYLLVEISCHLVVRRHWS